MAHNPYEQIDDFVRGICHYVNHKYETGNAPEFPDGMYIPSASLVNLMNHSIDHYNFEVFAFTDFLWVENRIRALEVQFKSRLKITASRLEHADFISECVIHIMATSYLRQNGFVEAPDILRNAMYEAFVQSDQHNYLHQWREAND